jgi:hypothetical protein
MLKYLMAGFMLFAALPGTAAYQLNGYGFGSGGTANSTTATYGLEGSTGEISGQTSTTAAYNVKPGFSETIQAHLPQIGTFDNGSGTYYNKLHFVIDQQNNPSDALYTLQISTSSTFASGNSFVKFDLSTSGTLTLADYQTYSAWGGAGGANIVGLIPNTPYYLRVKATQGTYTESAYGPINGPISTVNPSLSFSISTNSLSLGALLVNTVVNSASTINMTFATNALSGGDIYINGFNTGLRSTLVANTIPSATGDLSALSHGFGSQITATGTTTGTLTSQSPYNGTANNIGLTDTTIRKLWSATAPITGGSGSIRIKAKSNFSDAAATDYSETLTMLASGSF